MGIIFSGFLYCSITGSFDFLVGVLYMIMREWGEQPRQTRKTLWIYASVVALCCALYATLLSTRGMSPAEGWYSYYAYLINEDGAIPYVDFELLFPPLYTYLIAGFTSVFGYAILALRIFGVVVYALTGVFAFLIFEKLTSKPIFSLMAGLLAVSILQSEVVQIFYDYIRLMDLAVYASIYFLLCAVERIERLGEIGFFEPTLLLGIALAVLASMFKQSSGLIYLLYTLIFLLFAGIVLPRRRLYRKALLASVPIVIVMYGAMFAFLAANGSLDEYFYYNFKAATAAKGGSLLAVLFGWLFRNGPILFVYAAIVLLVMGGAWLLCRYLSLRFPRQKEECEIRPSLFFCVLAGLMLLGGIAIALFYDRFSPLWFGAQKPFTAFVVATAAFAIIAIELIVRRVRRQEPHKDAAKACFFCGAVFVLAYAVCTSGGLAESQIALGYPLVAMLFLPVLQFRRREIVALALAFLMLFHTLLGWARKTHAIYGWWGLEVGSVEEQTEQVDLPLLFGIRTNRKYADMYEGVVRIVQDTTEEGEEIFVFPHMPIFYLLCDRPRATNTAIQWFDVSTDRAVVGDIATLQEKKPRVLVLCSIGEEIIDAHEISFRQGNESGLRQMQDFLGSFVEREGYEEQASYTISRGYTVSVWVLSGGE